VNRKRVQRLWREEGLRVPQRKRKRRRLGESTVPAQRLRAERPNQVWAFDFQFAQTADGRALKLLNVVDEFTRESLVMLVARGIDADMVVATLDRLVAERGAPEHLRMDNGPEMTAHALRGWCELSNTGTVYIESGSPWQNRTWSPSTPACVTSCRHRGVLLPGRGEGRGRRLARGLQHPTAALRARDEGAGTLRRRVGCEGEPAGRRLTRSTSSRACRAGGCRRRARRGHRRYTSPLRRSAARRRPRIPEPPCLPPPPPIRPPQQLPSRRPVSTNSRSW
jgi:hypothetical protein